MLRPGPIAGIIAVGLLSTAAPATETSAANPAATAEPPTAASDQLLLGNSYPIDVSVSFHNGLLHWMDSLNDLHGAGLTGGKTVPVHRFQYYRVHGKPTARDLEMLKKFSASRLSYVRQAQPEERDRLTLAFFSASNLEDALENASHVLDDQAGQAFAESVRHFVPRYKAIWNDGLIPNGFLERTLASKQRKDVAEFLVGVARFFGVSPTEEPRPHLVLVPVPPGDGTHAQAIGPFLLIEVRRGESLADEVSPIVHENVHLLHSRIAPSRIEEMHDAVFSGKPRTDDAEYRLREALPTAIAQGVAGEAFQDGRWSADHPWYHISAVDRYAKRIFPIVKRALAAGDSFDETFLKEVIAAYDP